MRRKKPWRWPWPVIVSITVLLTFMGVVSYWPKKPVETCTTPLADARKYARDMAAMGYVTIELAGPEAERYLAVINAAPPPSFYQADILIVVIGNGRLFLVMIRAGCVEGYIEISREVHERAMQFARGRQAAA